MATTTTLAQVEQWLQEKPEEEVICWDTFDPWHCLMVRYYADHGHMPIRSEYNQAMIDTRMQDIRHSKETSKPRLFATYTEDLAQFNYHLSETSLRFRPTVGNILAYLRTGTWQEDTKKLYGWRDPDVFNAHYDDPARPEDVPWRHIDVVPFLRKERLVTLSLTPPLFYYNKGEAWRHVDLDVSREGWSDLESLYFRANPETRHATYSHGVPCSQNSEGNIRASLRLYEGDTVTLFTHAQGEMGTWQRIGEQVIRLK